MFFKTGIVCASCFSDVEFGAFSTTNYIYDVISLANKILVTFMEHLGPWTLREVQEGNVLFNDALNTFYLPLYGVGHMVNDYSESERGNLLPPHGPLLPISRQRYR